MTFFLKVVSSVNEAYLFYKVFCAKHKHFFSLNSCLGGSDNFKHLNEIDLFNNIDPNVSIFLTLLLLYS